MQSNALNDLIEDWIERFSGPMVIGGELIAIGLALGGS
jgi:hypothetical protein